MSQATNNKLLTGLSELRLRLQTCPGHRGKDQVSNTLHIGPRVTNLDKLCFFLNKKKKDIKKIYAPGGDEPTLFSIRAI